MKPFQITSKLWLVSKISFRVEIHQQFVCQYKLQKNGGFHHVQYILLKDSEKAEISLCTRDEPNNPFWMVGIYSPSGCSAFIKNVSSAPCRKDKNTLPSLDTSSSRVSWAEAENSLVTQWLQVSFRESWTLAAPGQTVHTGPSEKTAHLKNFISQSPELLNSSNVKGRSDATRW